MRKRKKIIMKSILPIAIAFFSAFIFFMSYNRYLLDRTLANLKISLKKLEKIQDPEVRKTIKAILDDTFIMEVVREEIDHEILAKLEFSNQIIDKMTQKAQLEDALYFIQDIIKRKEKDRSPILQALDSVLINLDSSKRQESEAAVEKKIKEIKKSLNLYKGEELQDKHFKIAKYYLLIKKWEEAIEYFQNIIEIEDKNLKAKKAFFYLGLVYKFKGDLRKAREIFSKIKNELTGELGILSHFEEGDSLYRMGKVREAIGVFENIFAKNPESQVSQIAQFRAGYIKVYDLGEVENVDEGFNKRFLMGLGENSRFSPQEISKLYDLEDKGIYDSFKEIRKKSLNSALIPAIAKAYRNKGFRLIKEGYKFLERDKQRLAVSRFVLSEEQFKLAIEMAPRDGQAHIGKALVLYLLKNPGKAMKEVRRARSISSNDPLVLANSGFIYTGLEMYESAIKAYELALKRIPNNGVLRYNLGTLYLLKGQYPKAREYFRKAKKIDPSLASIYNNMGYILWREKKYKEAKVEFEKSTRLDGDFLVGYYNLGIALFNFEKYEDAQKQFEKVKSIKSTYRRTEWYLNQINENRY